MINKNNNSPAMNTSHAEPAQAPILTKNIAGDIMGPVRIAHPEWPPGTLMVTGLLGCDNLKRVYAIGNKRSTHEYYVVRILIDIDGDKDGNADSDPDFGENGFVAMLPPNGSAISVALQIIEITDSHLTISVEVVEESGFLYQTALFRFLIDGQIDTTFGVNGFAVFADLPGPSSLPSPATIPPLLEPWKSDRERTKPHARMPQVIHAQPEDTRSTSPLQGKALANGQVLLVAYKSRRRGERFSYLIKVNEDGTLDSSFAEGDGYLRLAFTGSNVGIPYRISVDSRERSVVASGSEDGTYCLVARFSADGRLDPSFGGTGILRISSPAGALHRPLIKIDNNDKAVICVRFSPDGPEFGGIYLFRIDENGSSDPSFNNGNPIEFIPTNPVELYLPDNIAIDTLHRVILRGTYIDRTTGTRSSVLVSRFNAQGIDTSFGDAGSFSLPGRGISGGLTVQPEMAVVVSDEVYLWRLLDQAP